MNDLQNRKITIFEALENIKNGKYVMPSFQRQFVWSLEQIEKLWDSILQGYPIATFLFWKVDSKNMTRDTYFCDFLKTADFNSRKEADSINYETTLLDFNINDTAILDGQQRLTSLYLSLFGVAYIKNKYAKKDTANKSLAKILIELDNSKINQEENEFNNKKYDIKFTEKLAKKTATTFELKKILKENFKNRETRSFSIEEEIKMLSKETQDYARNILETLCKSIYDDALIKFTEIHNMNQDSALEMFVRFNNGGKPLRKNEIIMAIVDVFWPDAKKEFDKFLSDSYSNFGTDFIIRTALMLFGNVSKSNIDKKTVNDLKENWDCIKDTLNELEKVLKSIKIDIGHFSTGWTVLLPIIYCLYYNPAYKKNTEQIRVYLVRAVLLSYFKSATTAKLSKIREHIKINNFSFGHIKELEITENKIDDLVNVEKENTLIKEILYFLSLEWYNKNLNYEIDHLHPSSRFDNNKPSSISQEKWIQWRIFRNKLPNLHLLEGRANAIKNNKSLIDYYNDKTSEQQQEFLDKSFIPIDTSLEITDFEDFYSGRKQVLKSHLQLLLEEKIKSEVE